MQTLDKSICCRECHDQFKPVTTTQTFCFPCLLMSINQTQPSPIRLTDSILTDILELSNGRMSLVVEKSAGCGSSFLLGETTPQSLAAFLRTSLFSAALSRLFIMAGCFGQRSALTVLPSSSFPLHFSPSPDTVESIGGGYYLSLGVTA